MTTSLPQSVLDTSSFMGQMAARYRERMSMAFAVSNTMNHEAYSTKFTDGMNETIPGRGHHAMTDDGDDNAMDPHEGNSETKTSRSMSDLNRTCYSLKPSMKELIKKFEKRSFTSNQLRESDSSIVERRQTDFCRGTCEMGNLNEHDSMEGKTASQCAIGLPIESMTETNELFPGPQNSSIRGSMAECENLTDAVTGSMVSSPPEDAKARADKTLSQYQSFEDVKVSSVSADLGRDYMRRNGEGTMHSSELEKMLDSIVPDDGWASPLHLMMSGIESKTPSPLRTSLRGIAVRGKQSSSNDSKFKVHKKEWGKRYASKGTSNSIAYSPYSVHEIQSKTKSDSGRSVVTTPSNTLQRAEIRRTLIQHDSKPEEREKSSSKSDLRSNAMERYMKFLKHATPPLPAPAAGGNAVAGKGSSRPPTPRKPLNVNKRKIGQIKKTVLSAAKASGCVVVTNKLKPLVNKEDQNEDRKGRVSISNIKSKISTNAKSVDSNLKMLPKRQLERKKNAKIKGIAGSKDPKIDLSCRDAGTTLSNATSANNLPISSDITIESRGRLSAKSSTRSTASKLPTKISGEKRCPEKPHSAANSKHQESPSSRLSPTRDLRNLKKNADNQRHPSASVSNNILVQDSRTYSSSKVDGCRTPRGQKPSKKSEEKIDSRAKSSPARLSNRACRRNVQSPRDIRQKLFQKEEGEISDTEDKLLTEGELANNDLIPCHADEKQLKSASLNRFGYREKLSPVSTVRKCPSTRSHSLESDCFEEREYHLNSSHGSPGLISFLPETSPEKYKDEESEKTVSSALDDDGGKQFNKPETSYVTNATTNGKQQTKKALNTNSNLVAEYISSVSTYEDGDKSRTEDKFILAHLGDLGDGGVSTRTSPEKGHLSHTCPSEKGSPAQKAHRSSKDVLQELRYLDAYSSFSKEWAKDFGKGSRSIDGTDERNSLSAFHNLEAMSTHLEWSDEDGQATGSNSPIRKKRHLDKKKRSKRKRRQEKSLDLLEVQPSPCVNSSQKLLVTKKPKERKLDKLSKAAKPSESAKSQDGSRFQEPLKYYDSPVYLDRQRYHDQSKNQEHLPRGEHSKTQEHLLRSDPSRTQEHLPRNDPSRTQEHLLRREQSRTQEHLLRGDQPKTQEHPSRSDQEHLLRSDPSKTQEHVVRSDPSKIHEHLLRIEHSKTQEHLPRSEQTKRLCDASKTEINIPTLYYGAVHHQLPFYKPVPPVCTEPTERWKIRSYIPVKCDAYTEGAARHRCNILQQRRRWIEAYAFYDRPCRLPITENFRRCMESAIIEEYEMHSWFPNSDRLNSLSSEDTRDSSKMDTGPLLDSPLFTKDWLIEFLALLPYRKVGPLRMSQVGYLTLALSTLLIIHLSIDLYNCGGDDYDYFCDGDDVDCLMKTIEA